VSAAEKKKGSTSWGGGGTESGKGGAEFGKKELKEV